MINKDVLIIFICLLFLFPSATILKFIDLGMNFKKAIYLTTIAPKEIFKAHFTLYKKIKRTNKIKAFRILFMPITNFPKTIILYSNAVVLSEAKIIAIKNIIPTLNDKELIKFIKILAQDEVICGSKKPYKPKLVKSNIKVRPTHSVNSVIASSNLKSKTINSISLKYANNIKISNKLNSIADTKILNEINSINNDKIFDSINCQNILKSTLSNQIENNISKISSHRYA